MPIVKPLSGGVAVAAVLAVSIAHSGLLAAPRPAFRSDVITWKTPGHAVAIDVDISKAEKLFLVVTDGGNGYSCDWADWAEPRLVGPSGEKRLTELRWRSASADWGAARVDRNAAGGPLRIAGQPVEYGIGTHARSVIAYDLPPGFTRFKARGGLDAGGVEQGGCGKNASVRFEVHFNKPPGRPGDSDEVHDPANAVAALDVAEGLEATLFASEPTIVSPTNLDIDARGRVWVCEVVNYRGNNGRRPEGDRILILEDTDGDGIADTTDVFYQGRDIDSAMGITVLGSQVIVACSPNIFVFHDGDGDDRPDRRDVLFTKTGVPQHDHSAHSFVFGPDGKYYWNFGNTGRHVHDRDGNPVVDLAGNRVVDNGRPYFGGMVFRCNPDGSQFEVLGHNFRNNYEVAIDSFGTLWQSDNDDDGNRGVRINYVMEFGNYGYREERTGAGWRDRRTGMHEEIPLRHWHLNDPGVVPNLLQTGAGSPTGICVYEGSLLPAVFHGQVIHCDAGPSVVRAYPVERDGAGFRATTVNILEGTRNRWFRPADACVAPDGSLFVTDWYDPGVGGHQQRDLERGRIFRVAPPGHRYRVPALDLESIDGALAALDSPNLATRYLAWTALHERGREAEPALLERFGSGDDVRARARALWLLSKIDGRGAKHVERALADGEDSIRVTAIRAARQIALDGGGLDVIDLVERLARDPSPAVRRECAIALRHSESPRAPRLWAILAEQHDGKDRWYLEALGIAAAGKWDACLEAWLDRVGDRWSSPAGRDIIWRSRASRTAALIGRIIRDPATPESELPRFFRSLDFLEGAARDEVVLALAFADHDETKRSELIASESLDRLRGFDPAKNPEQGAALERVLDSLRGMRRFVSLIERLGVKTRHEDLLEMALADPAGQAGVEAASLLLVRGETARFEAALASDKSDRAASAAQVLGATTDGRAVDLLTAALEDDGRPIELRRQAARSLARIRPGAEKLIAMARQDKLDDSLRSAAAFQLNTAPWKEVREAAAKLFPLPAARDAEKLPPIAELLRRRGDARRGRAVYEREDTCIQCHIVAGKGKEVGPDLTEIGSKLSREALFESILFPSAGISHNYESWLLTLKNGDAINGIITSETPESVTLRGADAIDRKVAKPDIATRVRQETSLMPADLQRLMSAAELVDVVAFLETLTKKER